MGILVLYPDSENESQSNVDLDLGLDVIAVHGLNGDRVRTWTEPASGKLWLRDFLPRDIPRARVMTFSYNAKAAFQNSVADIEDHARDLLRSLVERRENSAELKRPLIFVGHSLGGLVIKQALILAEHESPYTEVYESTRGVIFFGTPHQGSNIATYTATLVSIANAVTAKPPADLLQSLRRNSEFLIKLNKDFILREKSRHYGVVSFYETKPMVLWNVVVEKKSAILKLPVKTSYYQDNLPTNATHRSMCQFGSTEDETYKSFLRSVKRMLQEDVKNELFLVPQCLSHNFTGRDEIRRLLRNCLISNRFIPSRTQQRFVLHGLRGSGKTQICLKFAQEHREAFWGIFWIDASSAETADEGYLSIARLCSQEENVDSVKSWLAGKDHWLLIIDNADDSTLELPKLFPSGIRGTILITSCNANSKQYGSAGSYRVDEMPTEDSINLLLKTAAISNTQDEKMRKAARDVATVLGNLALAIVQAGAVIRQRFCSLEDYCTVYLHQKKELLESGKPTPDENYKYSVYTTWEISINKIEQMCNKKSSFALDLLAILSFMHFDGIKEDFFRRACQNYIYRGGIFSQTCLHENMPSGWDQLSIGQALSILASSSLISMDETRRFTIHPLVHEWSRDRMCPKDRVQAWKLTASILAMSIKYSWAPDDEQHRRALLPHIDACLRFAESEKALFVEGSDLVERLIIADKFALTYHAGGRWSDSFTLYIEILKKREMILGPNHQDTLMSMKNVVVCLKRLCHYKEAIELGEQLVKKALQHPLPNQTENDHRVLRAKLDIAESWGDLGDYKAAQALYEQIIIDCTKGSFEDEFLLSDAKIGLASCFYYTNKFGEAAKLQEEVLLTFQRILPAEHLSRILVLDHLANSYDALKRTKKSRLFWQQTVDSMKLTLPENHPFILTNMALLASDFSWPVSKRKLEAAKGVLQKMKETLGEHHDLTLYSASLVAGYYSSSGCLQRARILQEYVVAGQEKIWPENHPHLLESRKFLSNIKRRITIRKVFYCWVPFNVDRFEPFKGG